MHSTHATHATPEPLLTVREVVPEDHAVWRLLWDGYNAFYCRVGATALPAEVTERTWARFLDPAEPMHALVAESTKRRGRLLGLAHLVFHRSTTLLTTTCYLQDLFTAPEACGRGVGRRLIEAAYAHARQAGAGRVYWQTHETNAAAMRLYDRVAERSGFLVYRKSL